MGGNIAWSFCFMKVQKFIPLMVVAAGLLAYNNRFMASYPKHVVTSRGDHHDLTAQMCYLVSINTSCTNTLSLRPGIT